MSIDPGGVGKGYAVDKMVGPAGQRCRFRRWCRAGDRASTESAVRRTNRAAGMSESETPKMRAKTAAVIYLKDNSLSTSGNYEKFFFAEGKI